MPVCSPQYFKIPPHVEAGQYPPALPYCSHCFISSTGSKGLHIYFFLLLPVGMLFAVSLSMILVILHMKVSAKNRKELSQTLTSLLRTIRTEKGCGCCDFFHHLEDENNLCLLEEWNTQINFETHRKSESFKVLLGAMNLLDEPCTIIFYRRMPGSGGIGQPCITSSKICIAKKGTHESNA